MARYEHLPIYADAYRLAVCVEEQVSTFSNRHRAALGADLRQQCRLMIRLIILANSQPKRRLTDQGYLAERSGPPRLETCRSLYVATDPPVGNTHAIGLRDCLVNVLVEDNPPGRSGTVQPRLVPAAVAADEIICLLRSP